MPVLLDFESRSRADLKKVGGRQYWAHPSTEALCCVLYDTESGEIEVWERGDPRPTLIDKAGNGSLGAHNAMGFDRFAAIRLGWVAPDADWIDTSELARAAGLPGGLDELAMRWLGLKKDSAASKFTKGLSSVRRPAGAKNPHAVPTEVWNALSKQEQRERGNLPACGPEQMARVMAYCLSDVEILAHGWPILETWQGVEPDVQRVDRAINERGVRFDSELARRLLEEDAINGERVCVETARVCGLTPEEVRKIARSDSQFPEFTGLPNAQKETLAEALLDSYLTPEARAMCAARDALASIARGKLTAGLLRVSPDGYLRDSHKYIGGHTWRWSHTGMQLGNMARPAKQFEDWKGSQIEALAEAVLAGQHIGPEEIDLLVRACLTASPGGRLIVEDFSGVEARALAWAAGDREAIAVHLDPTRSEYKETANAIFGCGADIGKGDPLYTAGKVSVLACGYQGGVGALERMAKNYRFSFQAHGVKPQSVVDGWRKMHAPIVKFWYACQAAMMKAISGRRCSVACFEFVPSGGDVAVLMPNGRPLVYNEAKIKRCDNGRPRITYMGRESYGGYAEDLYGGKIVENLIQSMCRELLAESVVECERVGLPAVLTVHDEIVLDVPESDEADAAQALHHIMTTVPEWAEGFPLGAAGHVGRRYRK